MKIKWRDRTTNEEVLRKSELRENSTKHNHENNWFGLITDSAKKVPSIKSC